MSEPVDWKARYEQLLQLYQVGQVLGSTLEPQEALARIVREAVRLTGASSGSIALVNPHHQLLEIQASIALPPGADQLQLKVGEGITGWVARTGKPARVADVREDPRYVLVKEGIRSELAVPLEVGAEVRGVLNVDSEQPSAFTASHQEVLELLARQAERVIHNTWLYEQIRQKARLFETLVHVGQAINSSLGLDEVLQGITREACQMMRVSMSSLFLADETGQWLDLRSSYGAGERYRRKPRLSVSDSLLGVVLRRRKPLQVENVQLSGRYQNLEVARSEGLVSLLSVPLVFGGQAIGTLNVYTGHPYTFSNEEISILSALAQLSALAIEKTRLYERIVEVEEELRQKEKLSALGLLAAEVAHEIRNPLTVLKMLYHSLDLRFPAEDPRHEDVRVMGEKMDHLNRIVEQVLNFARSTEPQPKPVNVHDMIRSLGLLVRHKLQSHQVAWREEFEAELPPVVLDAGQVEQALLNLILNAVEAMPQGGQLTLSTRRIHSSTREASCVEVAVADTGEGMTPEQRERAFSSLLSTTKPGGTGLGLALVRRVMETHQGEFLLESAPGRGTRVALRFSLPPEA